MAVNTPTSIWMQTTETGVKDVSTVGVLLTPVDDGDGNTQLIVYVLLGVGALAPVILLLTVAVVLRSRRTARHAVRRRATYNSAPAVDVVVGAWNSPVTGSTSGNKPTTAGAADRTGSQSNLSAVGSQAPETLSELAVREFFDVQDRQACRLYVSVEPDDGQRSGATAAATSPGTAASSTPGSGIWTSSSETSGEMERRAEDLVALIGCAASVGSKNFQRTAVTDVDQTQRQSSAADDIHVHSSATSTAASTAVESCVRNADNGLWPSNGSRSTVHTVVVDVEPSPVNGLAVDASFEEVNDEDEQRTPLPPGLSRMRRSEACYDIAQLSSSSPAVNVPGSPRRVSSKSSSPPPSPALSTSSDCWNHAQTEPTEDLFTEEEKALKYLDAIAYDYADHEVQEPIDERISKL